MITSGLVLTLNADAALAEQAVASLRARPEFTPGERNDRWLPVALEAADDAESRDLHDWLNRLPGVDFVDVVYVNFEEDEGLSSEEVRLNARPHPNPLPQGEGTAIESSLVFDSSFCESSRRYLAESANVSPSPGGEGRGEGERQAMLAPPSPNATATNNLTPRDDA